MEAWESSSHRCLTLRESIERRTLSKGIKCSALRATIERSISSQGSIIASCHLIHGHLRQRGLSSIRSLFLLKSILRLPPGAHHKYRHNQTGDTQ